MTEEKFIILPNMIKNSDEIRSKEVAEAERKLASGSDKFGSIENSRLHFYYSSFTKKEMDWISKNPHTAGYRIFPQNTHFITANQYIDADVPPNSYLSHRIFSGEPQTNNILAKFNTDEAYNKTGPPPATLAEIPYVVDYFERRQMEVTVIHWGQDKLLLSTQEFMLLVASTDTPTLVVYAGAAPGYNITLLAKLFPWVEWILIDPNLSKVAEKGKPIPRHDPKLYEDPKKFTIHPDYFDDKKCRMVKDKIDAEYKGYKILFISDIRREDVETSIDEDNLSNQRWLQIIDPDYSFLKFRVPRIDAVAKNGGKYEYLDGTIYIQPFAPPTTTEVRLLVRKKQNFSKKIYNIDEVEGKMFFFNRHYRVSCYEYPAGTSVANKPNYIDHCYDCARMTHIHTRYLDTVWSRVFSGRPPSVFKFHDDCIKYLNTKNTIETDTANMFKYKLKTDKNQHYYANETKTNGRINMIKNTFYRNRELKPQDYFSGQDEAYNRIYSTPKNFPPITNITYEKY